MKAMIDCNGFLHIERIGQKEDGSFGPRFKHQACPHTWQQDSVVIYCGDHCPLFGEPAFSTLAEEYVLSLCQTDLIVDELIDERGNEVTPSVVLN